MPGPCSFLSDNCRLIVMLLCRAVITPKYLHILIIFHFCRLDPFLFVSVLRAQLPVVS